MLVTGTAGQVVSGYFFFRGLKKNHGLAKNLLISAMYVV